MTYGGGCARHSDRYPECLDTVCLYVGGAACGAHEVNDGRHIVLEM